MNKNSKAIAAINAERALGHRVGIAAESHALHGDGRPAIVRFWAGRFDGLVAAGDIDVTIPNHPTVRVPIRLESGPFGPLGGAFTT